jgi:hypothetical protein
MTDPRILRGPKSTTRKLEPRALDDVPADWATADPPYTVNIEAHPDDAALPILKFVVGGESSGGFVPTYIAPTQTFEIPANRQALFAANIDNEGIIDAVGLLIEVD